VYAGFGCSCGREIEKIFLDMYVLCAILILIILEIHIAIDVKDSVMKKLILSCLSLSSLMPLMQAQETFSQPHFNKEYVPDFKQSMYTVKINSCTRRLFLTEVVLLKNLQECLNTAQSHNDCQECAMKSGMYRTYQELELMGVSVKELVEAFDGDL
jgi:hypothetical protein